MKKQITRNEYLKGTFEDKITPDEYFAQFVNEEVKQKVLKEIGLDKLLNSRDKHLNDIPLKLWDRLGGYKFGIVKGAEVAIFAPRTVEEIKPVDIDLLRKLGEVGERSLPSSATLVCIYKTAGRQLIDELKS